MSKKEFKDQCDLCNKFDYCRGFDDMILCQKCFKKLKEKETRKKEISNRNKEGN